MHYKLFLKDILKKIHWECAYFFRIDQDSQEINETYSNWDRSSRIKCQSPRNSPRKSVVLRPTQEYILRKCNHWFMGSFEKYNHGVDEFTRHAFPFVSHLHCKYKMMAVIPISLFLNWTWFYILPHKCFRLIYFRYHLVIQWFIWAIKNVKKPTIITHHNDYLTVWM